MAGALLSFVALLAPAVAEAQTTLVSNMSLTGTQATQTDPIAPSFTTGTEVNGYTLSTVRIASNLGTAALHLYADSSGVPPSNAHTGTSPLATFTGGGGTGTRTYSLTGGYTLNPSTTYWLVLIPGASGFQISSNASTSETGLPGWSLDAVAISDGNWSTAGYTGFMRVELQGSVRQPLAAPTNVRAQVVGAGVTLSWNAVPTATSYEYQQKRASGSCGTGNYGAWMSAGTGTSHPVAGLSPGTRYCFRVRGKSATDVGRPSAAVNATTPIGAPTNLTAEPAGSRTVALRWTRQASATGYDYQQKSITSGTCGTTGYGGWRRTGGNAGAHLVSGLTNGRFYCFRVRATTAAERSPASASASATPTDTPRLVYPAAVQVPEGFAASFDVKLGSQPAGTVTLTPQHGTPHDADISRPMTTNTLMFTTANWNTPQSVTVRAAEDSDRQDGESRLSYNVTASGSRYSGVTGHDISIFEIDDEFEATLTAAPNPVAEGEAVPLTATRDNVRTQPVGLRVGFRTGGNDGSAENDDFSTLCRPDLVFAPNSRTARCTVSTREDADTENDTFTAQLIHDDLVATDGDSVLVTIRDDAAGVPGPDKTAPLTVSLSVAPNPTDEGEDVTVTARLSKASKTTQTIPLTLTDGTAEGDEDYYMEALPIWIAAGQLTGSRRVTIHRDGDLDDDTFTVGLGTLEGGAAAGTPSSVLVRIVDDASVGGGGARGTSSSRDRFAYWDGNRDGSLTCSEARGLKLPAFDYTSLDPVSLHETAVTHYWLVASRSDNDPDFFGPGCPNNPNPSGYVPCGSVYNPDPAEQDAFYQCLARSYDDGNGDMPPAPTPVPALPLAGVAALGLMLALRGLARRRRRR